MEDDSRVLDMSELETNCRDLSPFPDLQTGPLLQQTLCPEPAQAPQRHMLDVSAVLQDLSALAAMHLFWCTTSGPAKGILKRQKQRREAGGEISFDTLRLDLSDEQAAYLVSITNPPGAPGDYLEKPSAHAKQAAGLSCVVCVRRWKALGLLELVVPLLFEISHVLLRPALSAAARQMTQDFVAQEVVALLLRRIAVWTSLNRSRPWEYAKLVQGLEVLMCLIAMPAIQLAALPGAVTDTLIAGMDKLSSSLQQAMQQLTMRNKNDAALAKEARTVCNSMEDLIEEALTSVAEDEAVTLHDRLAPLMAVIDQFT